MTKKRLPKWMKVGKLGAVLLALMMVAVIALPAVSAGISFAAKESFRHRFVQDVDLDPTTVLSGIALHRFGFHPWGYRSFGFHPFGYGGLGFHPFGFGGFGLSPWYGGFGFGHGFGHGFGYGHGLGFRTISPLWYGV